MYARALRHEYNYCLEKCLSVNLFIKNCTYIQEIVTTNKIKVNCKYLGIKTVLCPAVCLHTDTDFLQDISKTGIKGAIQTR